MNKATVLSLVISLMLLFAACADPVHEPDRIATDRYYGAKFDRQIENGIEFKIVHRAEDVANLIANLNHFAMETSEEPVEEWTYRITFVRSLKVSDDGQSFVFSPDESGLTVLISENRIQIGDQAYDASKASFEILQSKYDRWNHYKARQEATDESG